MNVADEIVCPYCGFEFPDSWDYGDDGYAEDIGIIQCLECDKEFHASRSVRVSYSTRKLELSDLPKWDTQEESIFSIALRGAKRLSEDDVKILINVIGNIHDTPLEQEGY